MAKFTGKHQKTYKNAKVRLDLFENSNSKGTKYHMFKLWIYSPLKQKPLVMDKWDIKSLKEILENIHILPRKSWEVPEESQEEVMEQTEQKEG